MLPRSDPVTLSLQHLDLARSSDGERHIDEDRKKALVLRRLKLAAKQAEANFIRVDNSIETGKRLSEIRLALWVRVREEDPACRRRVREGKGARQTGAVTRYVTKRGGVMGFMMPLDWIFILPSLLNWSLSWLNFDYVTFPTRRLNPPSSAPKTYSTSLPLLISVIVPLVENTAITVLMAGVLLTARFMRNFLPCR
ncbi:hypothetical protein EVAR_48687_1 [Eumeta japonica]|uniref:Uncharacterized protein n=1 Tax=Eumeta variegata TaxID=151549 RepID=A0A4C1X7F5_EUMVA|nr:hypothetical protein EVAR_48687_1 [Eumeta japonica]